MTSPFFSVVVPTFNRINRLLETIPTILSQSFTDFELIIVDDGSTDGTPEIINDKITDARLRIISQQNKERGAARNNGLKNAKGKYVVFFDSDDQMHANHLEVLHSYIRKLNNPDFISAKFDFINDKGEHKLSDMSNIKEGYYDYRLFLSGNPLACNICVRKENSSLLLFEEDRQFSIKEDWLFMISNMVNNKLYIIDKTTISMVDHDDRSMRSDNSIIIQRTGRAIEWIKNKIQLSDEEIKILNAHAGYFCGIHSYLDNKRKDAIRFSMDAIRNGGFKPKYITLLLKSVIGRKLIKAFR